jgi:hypothetical protein
MTRRPTFLAAILAAVLLLAGCAGAPTDQRTSPLPSNAPSTTADHTHGPAKSKLGLAPGVIDGFQEVLDVALIADDKLVEVDLLNTVGMLHGIFAIPQEGLVIITHEGRAIAWGDVKTDYPIHGTIPGPVKRVDDRVRMSADQLQKLMTILFPGGGKIEVRQNKLHVTTGR